jgi:hypothetical protein
MPYAEIEADRLWASPSLVRAPAVVTRVSKTFVSVALPPPYGTCSLPWPGPALRVGDRMTVAGELVGAGRSQGLRPLVAQVPVRNDDAPSLLRFLRKKSYVLVAIPQRPAPPASPTLPPPWLDVLVRDGLLDAKTDVRPDLYGCDAVGVLLSVHTPRGAIPRGFVHYDVKWGNDTDDLVGDLAAIAGHAERFSGVASDREVCRFEFRRPDGTVAEEVVEHDDGDLEPIAARMNVRLAELGTDRRIWTWDTGMDRFAFLGRSPEEVAALRDQGLPLDGLSMAGKPSASAGEADWSDVAV